MTYRKSKMPKMTGIWYSFGTFFDLGGIPPPPEFLFLANRDENSPMLGLMAESPLHL